MEYRNKDTGASSAHHSSTIGSDHGVKFGLRDTASASSPHYATSEPPVSRPEEQETSRGAGRPKLVRTDEQKEKDRKKGQRKRTAKYRYKKKAINMKPSEAGARHPHAERPDSELRTSKLWRHWI